jgi:glycosyltransferase involved in cell wall biosynthesis
MKAMGVGCPVIAVNNGGPTESVLHGETGYLCPQVIMLLSYSIFFA